MIPTKTFAERRSSPRSGEIHLRRRHNQVRAAHPQASLLLPSHREVERRRAKSTPFDVATGLELNLDRYPTKSGMLALLQSWLYAAEESGFASSQPDYAHALGRAVEIMKDSPDPAHAIVQLWRKENMELRAA